MIILVIAIFMVAGFAGGYAVCYLGTWAKLHRQESAIRALLVDVSVMRDLDKEVSPEWFQMQLESMLTWEEFA